MSQVADVEISGDMIRLGQLLKFVGIAESGSHAAALVVSGDVTVNGASERRRGRQLQRSDVIEVQLPSGKVSLRVA